MYAANIVSEPLLNTPLKYYTKVTIPPPFK